LLKVRTNEKTIILLRIKASEKIIILLKIRAGEKTIIPPRAKKKVKKKVIILPLSVRAKKTKAV